MHWYGDYGHMGGGLFLMAIFWPLAILGIVALVRIVVGGKPWASGSQKTALELLKERYARGEIGREEFEQIRRDIEK